MERNDRYDALKLGVQLCFPLYACARNTIKLYKPYLDGLDLTYTQYIVMLVLWEEGSASAKDIGERLLLDSGTLTPLLKKLESKGLIRRTRSQEDERSLIASLTEKGAALREKALEVPYQMAEQLPLKMEDARELYRLLYQLLSLQEGQAQ